MAFLPSTAAASLRAPIHQVSSSRRRSALPTAVRATANSNSTPQHPILSSLRHAASAAVLLAATSRALACTPSPPVPTPAPAALTDTVSPDEPVPEEDSHPFEDLIAETAALVRFGGADLARERLSSAAPGIDESCARLLAAQTLFVDGKVEEAIAAFEELAREDPADYRPLFCQGMLYFALGRTEESVSALVRCREVAGGKFEPEFPMALSPADLPVADVSPADVPVADVSPADVPVADAEPVVEEAEAEQAKV